jgi:hypothetical protein
MIGFITISIITLINIFVELWLGSTMLFSFPIIYIIAINFYINGMRKSVLIFRDALGLFKYDRYKAFIEPICGIILAIGFSFIWETFGVILGITLATFIICYIVEPYILYKYGFKDNFLKYYFRLFSYFIVSLIGFIITILICNNIFKTATLLNLVLRTTVCLIIPNILFLLSFFKTKEFKFYYNLFVKYFKVALNKFKRRAKNPI